MQEKYKVYTEQVVRIIMSYLKSQISYTPEVCFHIPVVLALFNAAFEVGFDGPAALDDRG